MQSYKRWKPKESRRRTVCRKLSTILISTCHPMTRGGRLRSSWLLKFNNYNKLQWQNRRPCLILKLVYKHSRIRSLIKLYTPCRNSCRPGSRTLILKRKTWIFGRLFMTAIIEMQRSWLQNKSRNFRLNIVRYRLWSPRISGRRKLLK